MRIIAGKYRGKKLETLSNLATRPTADKVRGAMFNALGQYFDGGTILDLFGGSGALALEAISRGAEFATIVDLSHEAIAVIRNNVMAMNVLDSCTIQQSDYLNFLQNNQQQFNYVFIDPPYKMDIEQDILPHLKDVLQSNGIIIIERALISRFEQVDSIQEYQVVFQRKYGKTELLFLKEKQ